MIAAINEIMFYLGILSGAVLAFSACLFILYIIILGGTTIYEEIKLRHN
jgi:hypothetical protein